MKRKALILGALPVPQEGPWVPLTRGVSWSFMPNRNYEGRMLIEVRNNGSSTRHPVFRDVIEFEGEAARVIIQFKIPNINLVTVNIDGRPTAL